MVIHVEAPIFVVPNGQEALRAKRATENNPTAETRTRAREAEATVDTLNRDLEEERKQNEEILHQMAFVEELITRVKKIENQVTSLESTKEVLLTRTESLTNLQDKGIESRKPNEQGRMVNSIELGIAGVQEMLSRLDQQIPADG